MENNRNEEDKIFSSEKLEILRYDVIRFNERYKFILAQKIPP